MTEEKKVDVEITRLFQDVKAIRTYNEKFTVHSTDEMGCYNQGILKTVGEGSPKLKISLKENQKRGVEVDLVFLGKREIRENFNPEEKKDWTTFGHIVLDEEQAKDLAEKILKILKFKKWQKWS